MSEALTPHLFSWSELMTTDPQKASEFYGALFDWQFDTMDMQGEDYYIALNQGEKIAGMMTLPAQAPDQSPLWGQYVTVTDIQATADKVDSLGGNVLTPPTDIPGVGAFIVFQDPQGAVLSAIQYAMPEGE